MFCSQSWQELPWGSVGRWGGSCHLPPESWESPVVPFDAHFLHPQTEQGLWMFSNA
jgi:hypothetical protein